MCDTAVQFDERGAKPPIFLKNSDREPGEAQAVERRASGVHPPGTVVHATYIDVPQVRTTRATILCRPAWMWGAEMGVNDAGVAVGNQAVFTRAPQQPVGLLGMDLVRLSLERAVTARGALGVITELLEQHGQGGAAGFANKAFRYHNSFILVDQEEAWVLETADRAWVAKRIRRGVRAISNVLTIREDFDLCVDGLRSRARDYGCRPGRRIDFRRTFADPLMAIAAAGDTRRGCVETALRNRPFGVGAACSALRSHGGRRAAAGLRATVCAHASFLPTRRGAHTTGSLVAQLNGNGPVFVTGTELPCVSVYKPVWFRGSFPADYAAQQTPDKSLFWRSRRVLDHAHDIARVGAALKAGRSALEGEIRDAAAVAVSDEERAELSRSAILRSEELLRRAADYHVS